MVQQVTVYDENGAAVGMTFPKRAKQLISKQRAVWHDETHTAVQLLAEAKDEVPISACLSDDDADEDVNTPASDDLLLYLAKRHVREKKSLTRHFGAFVVAWPVVGLFYSAIIHNTTHPQAWRMREIGRQLATVRQQVGTVHWWRVDEVERSVQAIFDSLVHPIMYVIFGVMIAWGVWILTRCVIWAKKNKRGRGRKVKPDPVQVEFQRLKGLGAKEF